VLPLVGVINAGSSSLKVAVYQGDTRMISGQVEGMGSALRMTISRADGEHLEPPSLSATAQSTPIDALPGLLSWLKDQLGGHTPTVLGHRVVHGGTRYIRPERVTLELLAELEALAPMAPLHQRHNLAPIRMMLQLNPKLPHVVCFDTAFHNTVPEVAHTFALPRVLRSEGVRRYGFHGLSFEYIATVLSQKAPELAGGRVVIAHLGNGTSLCALKSGMSIASTMGFSVLDGLPMGTRCGDLDPGVVLHLLKHKQMSTEAVEDLLYRHSGVLGLSEVSSDFRDLLRSSDRRAQFAVQVFCYQVVRHTGSLAAALDGIDGIVFTGGIGENAPSVRAAICDGCHWLGLDLDEAANLGSSFRISADGSRVSAYVIPTDENLMIARHTRACMGYQ
jgi:acetate kinase